jgi:hypothetical protein
MNVRWLPIVAAAVGVLGGVLGALAGGWISNKGQESGFERARKAQIQDIRREVYADFVGAADKLAIRLIAETATPSDAQTYVCDATVRTEKVSGDEVPEDQWAAYRQVLADKARVILVTKRPEVEKAAFTATETLNIWMAALAASEGELAQACFKAYSENDINRFGRLAKQETQ